MSWGIITGSEEDGETVFLPDQPITRAEISVIVWQVDRVHTYGEQILFQGAYYDILEDVPVNTYDPEGFSKDENGYITYTEDGVYVTKGVDVSVHQGTIDWQQVADAGFDFAMIRVGYRGYGTEGQHAGRHPVPQQCTGGSGRRPGCGNLLLLPGHYRGGGPTGGPPM